MRKPAKDSAGSSPQEPIRLLLEKPVYGGDCLAHLSGDGGKPGKAIFVPLTLPGECIEAAIREDKRSFAKAEMLQLLEPSPHRIPAPCAHFGACGGCHYQHTEYGEQLRLKREILHETLTRAGVSLSAEIEELAGEPWAYRNRVRFALTRDAELAYRGRRSHELVAIRECPIAAPLLLETARLAAGFIAENPAPAPMTELELFTNHDASQLLLTLFTSAAPHAAQTSLPSWLAALHAALPPATTGIRLQLEDGSLQPAILAQTGQSSLTYTAQGHSYRVDHGAFFQVNRWLIDPFVTLVTGGLQSAGVAWDLYAGVGLFARQLAASFGRVDAVEAAPASIAALNHNLEGTNTRAIPSPTLDFLRRSREQREERPDLIVVDPPRSGLGPEVTQLLNAIHAPQMVYVSCDPATLARDLRLLTEERYRIESITLVDMFPQTFHIETVVKLRRA